MPILGRVTYRAVRIRPGNPDRLRHGGNGWLQDHINWSVVVLEEMRIEGLKAYNALEALFFDVESL